MEYKLTAKKINSEIVNEFESNLPKKLDSLSKYFDETAVADIRLDENDACKNVIVKISDTKNIISASFTSSTFASALDEVVSKIKKQSRREKDKNADQRHGQKNTHGNVDSIKFS